VEFDAIWNWNQIRVGAEIGVGIVIKIGIGVGIRIKIGIGVGTRIESSAIIEAGIGIGLAFGLISWIDLICFLWFSFLFFS
jgi:hypothetical protein